MSRVCWVLFNPCNLGQITSNYQTRRRTSTPWKQKSQRTQRAYPRTAARPDRGQGFNLELWVSEVMGLQSILTKKWGLWEQPCELFRLNPRAGKQEALQSPAGVFLFVLLVLKCEGKPCPLWTSVNVTGCQSRWFSETYFKRTAFFIIIII